jgi:hypothetical protein
MLRIEVFLVAAATGTFSLFIMLFRLRLLLERPSNYFSTNCMGYSVDLVKHFREDITGACLIKILIYKELPVASKSWSKAFLDLRGYLIYIVEA